MPLLSYLNSNPHHWKSVLFSKLRIWLFPLALHWGVYEFARECSILQAAKIRGRKEDAYQVVGLEADCKAGEVKKRYWKLSLLIHPDKCSHPRAQDAFNALSQAAKDLQVVCPVLILASQSLQHLNSGSRSIVRLVFMLAPGLHSSLH